MNLEGGGRRTEGGWRVAKNGVGCMRTTDESINGCYVNAIRNFCSVASSSLFFFVQTSL